MAPGRFVTSGMEVFSKLVMMPIARHSQRRRRVMSAASEILTENCRLLRLRISSRSELGCGPPPCRHRGNTPSAAGLSPPRCCCDSTEEFAAGRGFIRPRLGLGNLLVDIEREGSYRHADEGPSPPRRCDFTEFVAGSRFIRRRIGFGDRHVDAGTPPPRRCDSTEFSVASGSATSSSRAPPWGRVHLAGSLPQFHGIGGGADTLHSALPGQPARRERR
uniref:Uncharacterized protein n=1 Tax=Oryza meridionalis TaxID=40149 RepID=A0A0E0CF65_9ORYZ